MGSLAWAAGAITMGGLDMVDIKMAFTCQNSAKKDPPRVRRFTVDKHMDYSEFKQMVEREFGHSQFGRPMCPSASNTVPWWVILKFVWTDADGDKVEVDTKMGFEIAMKEMKPGRVHKMECKCV